MKKLVSILIAGSLFVAAPVAAKTVNVKGYYKPSTGTYVAPSVRTAPNKTKLDNYSTQGNYNPYSGKSGSKKAY